MQRPFMNSFKFSAEKPANVGRRYSAENGALLFARFLPKTTRHLPNFPLFSEALRPGDIVEISGESGSGKRSILTDIAARFITGHQANGLGSNVIYLDCSGQFFINRLLDAVNWLHIQETFGAPSARAVDECLRRFHYLSCQSSRDLLHAFELLDKAASDRFPDGFVLLVDTINAFYWLDRSSTSRSFCGVQEAYAARLSRFLSEHGASAIVTRFIIELPADSNFGVNENQRRIAPSTTMHLSWRNIVTRTIQLYPESKSETVSNYRAVCDGYNVEFYIDERGITFKGPLSGTK